MKQIILIVCTLAAVFSSANAFVPTHQDSGEIPLQETIPPFERPRDVTGVPVICNVSSAHNELYLHTTGVVSNANVVIENTTTNVITNSSVCLTPFPLPFALFGSGHYTITITLSSGAEYSGSFCL